MIGSLVTVLNFIALYAINKPRSGTAVIIGKLVEINFSYLLILIASMIVTGSIAVFISIFFAKIFAKNIHKINYNKMSLGVIIILILLSMVLSGPISLVVLITATATGILASEFGIKKMHLMGCLILPVILYLSL